MQLDYSLTTPEERIKCVEQLLAETPSDQLNKGYLSYMSDYILFIADRNQTKKEKDSENPIITKNREVTVNKRQISYEEIVSNLENGEDGIYALISTNKNQLLDPKERVSSQDIEEIPGLSEQFELIDTFKKQFDKATGIRRYHLKRSIIETWQQIYILRSSYKAAVNAHQHNNGQVKTMAHLDLREDIWLDENRLPRSNGVLTLLNPAHISYLLCFYSKLKEESWDNLQGDMHFLLLDLEDLVTRTLEEDYPILYDIVIWKIDGLTNEQIQEKVQSKYGEWHSEQYYSSLWRKRIPNLLLEQSQKDYLMWHYTNVEKGYWKRCSKCGEYFPGHPLFFHKNSSKDGYYSWCRKCKSKKGKK